MPDFEYIPDPGLTLSEAMNVMGVVLRQLYVSPDPVLQSAWEKMRAAAAEYAADYPDEYQAIVGEVQMQKRFGMGQGS